MTILRSSCLALMLTACSSASPDQSSLNQNQTIMKPSASSQNKPSTAAPARDGNIAIREEFDAAKAKNTREAYGLFIARHPDHPLTTDAKQLKAQLETLENTSPN